MTQQPDNKIIIALALATVNESIGFSILVPCVGVLMSHITGKPVADSGYLSGFLLSSFFLGQLCTGHHFGKLSDRVGRKPVIFCGMIAALMAQILFGLSDTIALLFISRFFHGFFSGNMATIKTAMCEVTAISSDSATAAAFSGLSLAWGIGSIIGVVGGGILYDPCNENQWNFLHEYSSSFSPSTTNNSSSFYDYNYSLNNNLSMNNNTSNNNTNFTNFPSSSSSEFLFHLRNFLLEYPAFPVCLASSCYCLFSIIILYMYLPETHHKFKESGSQCCLIFVLFGNLFGNTSSDKEKRGAIRISTFDDIENDNNDDNNKEQEISNQIQDNTAVIAQEEENSHNHHHHHHHHQHNEDETSSSSHFTTTEVIDEIELLRTETIVSEENAHHSPTSNRFSQDGNSFLPKRSSSFSSESCSSSSSDDESENGNNNFNTEEENEEMQEIDDEKNTKHQEQEQEEQENKHHHHHHEELGFFNAFKIFDLRACFIFYMALAAHDIAFGECFALLAIQERNIGGLNVSVKNLGMIQLTTGITQISSNVLFPPLFSCFSYRLMAVGGLIVFLIDSALPWMQFLIDIPSPNDMTIFVVVLLASIAIRQLFITFSYTSNTLAVKDAAPKKHLGEVIGITQTTAAFVRLVVPALASPFFSFTATHDGFPLPHPYNTGIIFYVCGIIGLFSCIYISYARGYFCFSYNDNSHDNSTNNRDGRILLPTSNEDDDENEGNFSVVHEINNENDDDDEKVVVSEKKRQLKQKKDENSEEFVIVNSQHREQDDDFLRDDYDDLLDLDEEISAAGTTTRRSQPQVLFPWETEDEEK